MTITQVMLDAIRKEWTTPLETRITELESALRGLVQRHPHHGSCCTYGPDNKIAVPTEASCVCEPHEKAARNALQEWTLASISDDNKTSEGPHDATSSELQAADRMRAHDPSGAGAARSADVGASASSNIANSLADRGSEESASARELQTRRTSNSFRVGDIITFHGDKDQFRIDALHPDNMASLTWVTTQGGEHPQATPDSLEGARLDHRPEPSPSPSDPSPELRELARKVVESQKARVGEDIDAWAEQLAADSCAAGGVEYGPDYGKRPPEAFPPLDFEVEERSGWYVKERESPAGPFWQVAGPFRRSSAEALTDYNALRALVSRSRTDYPRIGQRVDIGNGDRGDVVAQETWLVVKSSSGSLVRIPASGKTLCGSAVEYGLTRSETPGNNPFTGRTPVVAGEVQQPVGLPGATQAMPIEASESDVRPGPVPLAAPRAGELGSLPFDFKRCDAVHPDEGGRCVYGAGHPIEYHCDGDRRWPQTNEKQPKPKKYPPIPEQCTLTEEEWRKLVDHEFAKRVSEQRASQPAFERAREFLWRVLGHHPATTHVGELARMLESQTRFIPRDAKTTATSSDQQELAALRAIIPIARELSMWLKRCEHTSSVQREVERLDEALAALPPNPEIP